MVWTSTLPTHYTTTGKRTFLVSIIILGMAFIFLSMRAILVGEAEGAVVPLVLFVVKRVTLRHLGDPRLCGLVPFGIPLYS